MKVKKIKKITYYRVNHDWNYINTTIRDASTSSTTENPSGSALGDMTHGTFVRQDQQIAHSTRATANYIQVYMSINPPKNNRQAPLKFHITSISTMAQPSQESQFELAQRMYTPRAADYENSWHPSYTQRFMSVVNIQPGQRVLILACGTGLEAEIAAPLVGDTGLVVGVDATGAMLDEARRKQERDPLLKRRLRLYQHDVTDLSGCDWEDDNGNDDGEQGGFDWIICSNAFVLFDDPERVLSHWRGYLRPGGCMAIDITHELNLRQGLILEKVARSMGLRFPSNREWIKSRDSFRKILEESGLEVERIELLEKTVGEGSEFHDVSDAKKQFDYISSWPITQDVIPEERRAEALALFEQGWAEAAVDGKVEVSNSLYVYIARKV